MYNSIVNCIQIRNSQLKNSKLQMSLYSKRGVSAQKEEVHAAVQQLDQGLYPNAFCKIYPDYLGGDQNFVNVMHADGAGTKSILAYLYWKETGDINVWKGIAQDAVVMNLDDLLSGLDEEEAERSKDEQVDLVHGAVEGNELEERPRPVRLMGRQPRPDEVERIAFPRERRVSERSPVRLIRHRAEWAIVVGIDKVFRGIPSESRESSLCLLWLLR